MLFLELLECYRQILTETLSYSIEAEEMLLLYAVK